MFFTIQSNLIVGVTTLLLAIRLDRTSLVFRVFRLMGIVGIVVTAIVYHVAIRAFLHLDSWALAADHLLHTVVPVLAVYGWLRYGPRGLTSATVARLTVLFPLDVLRVHPGPRMVRRLVPVHLHRRDHPRVRQGGR